MARPKRDPDSLLDNPVRIRLTAADRAAFVAKAAAAGMSQSEFFRQCILLNRTTVVQRHPASVDRKRILFVVNRTGNNLNQIAHVLNTQRLAGKLSEHVFESVLEALESIEMLLEAHLNHVD